MTKNNGVKCQNDDKKKYNYSYGSMIAITLKKSNWIEAGSVKNDQVFSNK